VKAFPTVLLINPEGKLVEGGSAKLLREKLDRLRKERKAAKKHK